jgi:hypothetical protein
MKFRKSQEDQAFHSTFSPTGLLPITKKLELSWGSSQVRASWMGLTQDIFEIKLNFDALCVLFFLVSI